MKIGFLSATLLSLLLAACAAPTPREPLKGHISTETLPPAAPGAIPAPVRQTLALPAPRAKPKAETYSVVVNNVPVRDLLFALARDAKVNVDIHPGISGVVSLNAIDQTLPQLLTRISRQVDLRFQLDGPNLSVMPDTPYLKSYKVDYVNMSRNVTSAVSTDTQIATTGIPTSGTGVSRVGGAGGNVSSTRIEDSSKNMFWVSLEKNIKDILRETDKVFPAGSSPADSAPDDSSGSLATKTAQALAGKPDSEATKSTGNTTRSGFREAASVIVNAETGIISVRATQRQHEKIQEFLDRVINSAHRQVQIEATIVEVTLNDGYSQGIDWTALSAGGVVHFLGASAPNTAAANLTFTKTNNNPTALITLLSTFGTSKVLSSPRISVLNNQTALLKVVENVVYFNVKEDVASTSVAGAPPTKAITTTPQTVSIGLVLSVTPQISDADQITLNVRPTITSISAYVQDPNPDLTIQNLIPQIRTREVESVMRVASGNTAILGGLMEDGIDYQNQRVPLVGQIPLVGELANNRNNSAVKKELVIFLRPVVVKDASLAGDYADMRKLVPDEQFFQQPAEAQPFNVTPGR